MSEWCLKEIDLTDVSGHSSETNVFGMIDQSSGSPHCIGDQYVTLSFSEGDFVLLFEMSDEIDICFWYIKLIANSHLILSGCKICQGNDITTCDDELIAREITDHERLFDEGVRFVE